MKAITVQQPWAFAIATGAKTVENRVRPHPWQSAVGQRVAIHAGKAWDVVRHWARWSIEDTLDWTKTQPIYNTQAEAQAEADARNASTRRHTHQPAQPDLFNQQEATG